MKLYFILIFQGFCMFYKIIYRDAEKSRKTIS